MPSEAQDDSEPKFDREVFQREVLEKIHGLSREVQVAIAARAAWRVMPLMFFGLDSDEKFAKWWSDFGVSFTSKLVLAMLYCDRYPEISRASISSAASFTYPFATAEVAIAADAAAFAVSHAAEADASIYSDNAAYTDAASAATDAAAFAISYAVYAAYSKSKSGGQIHLRFVQAIRFDIEQANERGAALVGALLWKPSLVEGIEFWPSSAFETMRSLQGTDRLHAWLRALMRGEPPLLEMRQWFNEWWLSHPKNTAHASAFEDGPPSGESPSTHDFGEPFILRKIYKDPVISNSLAGDGAAPKLTDTAEKCKEALRAFVASGETEAPITVSVEAPWGAGKTSFLHHLRSALEEKDRIPTVWFNPWKHEAGKTLWAAFAVAYERQMAQKLFWPGTVRRRLMLSWQRLSMTEQILLVLRLVMWLLGMVALGWLWCHGEDFAKDAGSKANSILVSKLPLVGIPLLLWGLVKDMVGSFGSPLKIDMVSVFTRNQHKDGVDDLHRFHEDFERLMCAYKPSAGLIEKGFNMFFERPSRPLWSQNRVVVFIDDLDRCEAPKAAEVLQSLHLMLSGGGHERRKDAPKPPGVICILGMDREKVAAAVAAKHEKLLPLLLAPNEKDGKVAQQQALGFGHEYLEKFIQITLHLPGLAGQDQDQYLRMITGWKGDEAAAAATPAPGGSQPAVAPAPAAPVPPAGEIPPAPPPAGGRETSDSLTVADRRKAEEARRTQREVKEVETQLSDGQTAYLCASYVIEALERNPRRLKQFVNLFRLRLFLAAAMRLLDIATLDFQNSHRYLTGKLSGHDIAKLVALDLCCPQTMSGLREEAGISLETIKERVKKEHPEPRQAVILKMLDSGINGDPESNSAHDLSKAPLEMYFQQLASVAQPAEVSATQPS